MALARFVSPKRITRKQVGKLPPESDIKIVGFKIVQGDRQRWITFTGSPDEVGLDMAEDWGVRLTWDLESVNGHPVETVAVERGKLEVTCKEGA